MTTLTGLIQKVLLNLEGYNSDSDIYGTLSANINSSATTFTVTGSVFPDGSGFSTGLIEIGNELCYVRNINRTTGQFSDVIRGFRGTAAEAHTTTDIVRNNPRYPISAVKNAINSTIKSLYPRLIAPAKIEFTGIASKVQYELPENTLGVLSVQWLPTGASKAWAPVTHWSFDSFAGSNSTSSKSINIQAPVSGRKIQVVYATEPTELNYTDEFITTNLPVWMEEVIILGACWRLVSFVDAAKVLQNTAEQALINNNNFSTGSVGTNLAKYYLGLFEQQITLAQQRQSKELPIQKHKLI
jgi:hypothetical protein